MTTAEFKDFSAFILAGGRSSRMGKNKAFLEIDGVPLVLHLANLVRPIVSTVVVIGPPDQFAPAGLDAVADQELAEGAIGVREGRQGPLAGIVTALANTKTTWNVVLACDLLYMTSEWLQGLILRASRSEKQAVIPVRAGGPEPLAAAYRKDAYKPLAGALGRGVLKVTEAVRSLDFEEYAEREWSRGDEDTLVLKSVNTPEDYREASRWRAGKGRRDAE